MKYLRTAGFLIDLRRLPAEHRKLFVLAVQTLPAPGSPESGGYGLRATPMRQALLQGSSGRRTGSSGRHCGR